MKKSLNLIFLLCSIVSFAQNITGTITDSRDGKVYKTVVIGNQTWMAENLNVSTFRNGDSIPEAKTNEEWEKAGEEGKPAWCYYENDTSNGRIYGKLYNWYAVNDPRGLAPVGYHIPSDDEWRIIDDYLGNDAEKKMKSQSGWNNWEDSTCSNCKKYGRKTACNECKDKRVTGKNKYSGNGTNGSGFSGLPGGQRSLGNFYDVGNVGYWWEVDDTHFLSLSYNRGLNRMLDAVLSVHVFKEDGFSVRCVKD
jgi:uncharacterized protein (TIGR02145 family)